MLSNTQGESKVKGKRRESRVADVTAASFAFSATITLSDLPNYETDPDRHPAGMLSRHQHALYLWMNN
jgi:hypothetical protein